jgi:hypothetical protein
VIIVELDWGVGNHGLERRAIGSGAAVGLGLARSTCRCGAGRSSHQILPERVRSIYEASHTPLTSYVDARRELRVWPSQFLCGPTSRPLPGPRERNYLMIFDLTAVASALTGAVVVYSAIMMAVEFRTRGQQPRSIGRIVPAAAQQQSPRQRLRAA